MENFDYPAPNKEEELDAIQERVNKLARVSRTVSNLDVAGVDATRVEIAGLYEISTRAEKLAREIGLHAIAEGQMSQVQLGQLLGVHQTTISRWIADNTQEDQEESSS